MVQEFNAALPQNSNPRGNSLTDAIQMAYAGGGGVLANPLRARSLLPFASSMQPEGLLEAVLREHHSWWEAAWRIEVAAFDTLNWIRSQLPGFPMLPAPQLAADSPLTTNEYTRREAWPSGLQSLGLGGKDMPGNVSNVLLANRQQKDSIQRATRLVLQSLESSPQWSRLTEVRARLSKDDIRELLAAKRRLRERLKPHAIDEYEDSRAMLRDWYRIHATETEVASLSGAASDFAVAFEEAGLLAEDAVGTIFGQLVCVGIHEVDVENVEVWPGPPGTARFRLSMDGFRFPQIGDLVWVRDPVLPDVVSITGVSFNFSQLDGELVQVRGSILSGSGDGFARLSERDAV